MFKRVLLFLGTNLLVIATISIVTRLLGLHSYLTAQGINYQSLAIFCVIWGTAGAFISLFMSKIIAKKTMGVELIDPNRANSDERKLIDLIYKLARGAGLTVMPEVGIYQSPELNAFATGPSKTNSLVAVSSGLLQKMNLDEIEGVLGHEISHVANGDMVTMTLLQGIINAFALFLSRILAYILSASSPGRDDDVHQTMTSPGGMSFYLLTTIFDVLLTFLGSLLVAAFSRYREYRADKGGARLAGREKMIGALRALQRSVEAEDDTRGSALANLKISHKDKGIRALFSSHPPLELRIQRLQEMRIN